VEYFHGGSATTDDLRTLKRKQHAQISTGELSIPAIGVAIKILQYFHCAAKYFPEFISIYDY
jgi:hypothetical protein